MQKDEIIKEINKEFNSFKKDFKSLTTKIDKVKKTADDALKRCNETKNNIVNLEATMEDISTKINVLEENSKLNVRVAGSDQLIKSLEIKV